MTPAAEQRDRVFFRDCPDDHRNPRCFASLTIPGAECSGRLELAHALPKASIRNYISSVRNASKWVGHPILEVSVDEVIYDPDCGLVLCAACHERYDKLGVRPCLDQLPDHVHRWAERYWLTHRLEAYYPARLADVA